MTLSMKPFPPLPRWTRGLDLESPDLGLPILEGFKITRLYTACEESGTYAHHSYITSHKGLLFAAWSNHARDEDSSGQRVLMSCSGDHGATWAPWRELFAPHDRVRTAAEQDTDEDRVLIPNGFAVVGDDLYAIAEVHVLTARRGFGRIARRLDGGAAWGPVFWTRTHPPEPCPGFPQHPDPSDLALLPIAGEINRQLALPEHLPSWEFLHHTSHPKAADGRPLCEPTQGWRLPSGDWAQFLRDIGPPGPETPPGLPRRNYVRFSSDHGATWTPAVRSGFPDACSRSAVCTLPDGAVAVINNPAASRDPLVLSLASDGLTFDRHAVIACGAPPRRYEGSCKDPGYQYPRAVVAEDTLFVMYSVNKEDVEVAAIPLADLARLHAGARR